MSVFNLPLGHIPSCHPPCFQFYANNGVIYSANVLKLLALSVKAVGLGLLLLYANFRERMSQRRWLIY